MTAKNNTIKTDKVISKEIALIDSIAERLAADSGVIFTKTDSRENGERTTVLNKPANKSK